MIQILCPVLLHQVGHPNIKHNMHEQLRFKFRILNRTVYMYSEIYMQFYLFFSDLILSILSFALQKLCCKSKKIMQTKST